MKRREKKMERIKERRNKKKEDEEGKIENRE